jgi:Ca-activated chloride channel homolog
MQIAATAVFAAVLTGALVAGTRLGGTSNVCHEVLVASSQEKAGMLQDFAAAYNRTGPTVGGRCIHVSVEQVNSGDAERALAGGWKGPTRPHVWSPASSAWVKLLAAHLPPADAARMLPVASDSLFQSPLVIGMPAQMAAALGYPAKAVGWARILELAHDPRGWATYGHPEWGQFKLGKTNPTISTSGLHALIGVHYAAPGGSNLSTQSVTSPSVQSFVREIEASVVHYGQTAAGFLRNLRYADDQGELHALQYISAIAVEEKELADYNSGLVAGSQRSAPRVKLVAIYPTGGSPVANHPYVVLGWSSSQVKAAAGEFERFIKAQKSTIEARNFRFGDPKPELAALVLPTGNLPPLVALEPPPGAVLDAMIRGWSQVRKAARVLILIDVAVNSRELSNALKDLGAALAGFSPQDRVGVWTFPAAGGAPSSHSVLREPAPDTASLTGLLSKVTAGGDASDLDGALHDAVVAMAATYDKDAIDGVLVLELAPGDTGASSDLVRFLSSQVPVVRVFTIGPNSQRLQLIALASGGASYEPGSASHFLNDAISNF